MGENYIGAQSNPSTIVSALPKPDGWSNRYLLVGVGGTVVAAGFGFFGYKTVIAAGATHWLAMIIALCGTVAFGIMTAAVIVRVTAATKLRGRYDEKGTTFDAVPAGLWIIVMCGALSLGIGLYLLYSARVHADWPSPSTRDTGRLTALAVVSVLCAAMLLWNMRKGKPALALSPDGIDYRFPGECTFTVSWDDIVDITGVPLTKRGKGTRPIVFVRADGTRVAIAHASTWVPGGTALYWLCRHYWRYPADRCELVNGVALDRLTGARITAA
ncbi:hypothetical protein [Mycolicibacterium llatzerense]|uniref:hypothetical protein n=1 Tax=Mycolicibacterium llatzerense TaxID=280871 RepID=UPI0031D0D716